MKRWIVIVAVLSVLWACQNFQNILNSSNSSRETDLQTSFFLQNASGHKTTIFEFGQDIFFHYEIQNHTAHDLPFQNPDTGPFASFSLYKDGLLIGTSDDGLAYATMIVLDTLSAGEVMKRQYSWLETPQHGKLPTGNYLAVVHPRLHFEDVPTPGPDTLQFAIVCPTSVPCDSASPVIITERTPHEIQLDAFELNSASIQNNRLTLNVSYSGGCVEHDFMLFMSPGAFLESFPVQANLYLRHNGFDDACEAYAQKNIVFDLEPIVDLYVQFYGTREEIVLNIFDYFQQQLGDKIQISYQPD